MRSYQDTPLPAIRPDVEIFVGPFEGDGSPTYVIHDPVVGSFNKIGWGEAAVLQRLRRGQTLSSMVRELTEQTTLDVSPQEVAALCEDAQKKGLTIDSQVQPPQKLLASANSKKMGPLKWVARHYLYFRVPLFHPDDVLADALPWVRPLGSRQAVIVYLIAGLIGLYFLSQRFESYLSTFANFMSVSGFIAYGTVIVVLKALHELGHAFVAKNLGVRVPTMGLAFMVFAPMAYSNVTDAWRLRRRRDRAAIALAGVKVELAVGAFAMALWGLTPPGTLNSVCFLLSSATLAATLLVNLNPLMRYDGYYILSDVWGVDNLLSQSTQFAKWFLRRQLLGLDAPCPLSERRRGKQFQLVLYAFAAWAYRLLLYLGIAVIVYYKFTKALGICLFVVQIMNFTVRPIVEEVRILMKQRDRIKVNWRLGLTLAVLLLVGGWAIVPLPRIKNAPGILLPAHSQILYAPRGGRIKAIMAQRGDRVRKGDALIYLDSESLNNEIEYLTISSRSLRYDIATMTVDDERVALIPEMEKQMAATEEQLAAMVERRNQFAIKAKMSGTLVELDPMLRSGDYVKERQTLGRIVSTNQYRVDAFVSEKEIKHLSPGQEVTFYPADCTAPIAGIVEHVDPIRKESVDYLDIGSVGARELPLVPDSSSDRLTLLESYYRVRTAIDDPLPENSRAGRSGFVRYRTGKLSLGWELALYCYSILIRESSF